MAAGEGITDDTPPSWGWGVARMFIQDRWIALCFDCEWQGDQFYEAADARRQLAQHLTTADHQTGTDTEGP
jgi:hypothetical protein